MRARRSVVAIIATSAALTVVACQSRAPLAGAGDDWPARLDDAAFWARVRDFSEPGGSFAPKGDYRSDNLVSNERSLQHVIPSLLGVRRSGAYIGVVPSRTSPTSRPSSPRSRS